MERTEVDEDPADPTGARATLVVSRAISHSIVRSNRRGHEVAVEAEHAEEAEHEGEEHVEAVADASVFTATRLATSRRSARYWKRSEP